MKLSSVQAFYVYCMYTYALFVHIIALRGFNVVHGVVFMYISELVTRQWI